MWIIEENIPEYDDEVLLDALQLAIEECNSLGLTGIHDAGVDAKTLDLFRLYFSSPSVLLVLS